MPDAPFQPDPALPTPVRAASLARPRRGRLLAWSVPTALSIAIVVFVSPVNQIGALLAELNLVLAFALAVNLWRTGGLSAAPALGFLPGIAVSWPLSCLYFAAFSPDAVYSTMFKTVTYVENARELQLCVFVFLLGYGGTLLLSNGGPRRVPRSAADLADVKPTGAHWDVVMLGLGCITVGWVCLAIGTENAILSLVGNGLRIYFSSLTLVAGFYWSRWQRWQRWVIGLTLAVSGVVYTLANGRSVALWPVLFLALGYLLSPLASRRWRIAIVTTIAICLPFYIVFGNQTRKSDMAVGFTDLGGRAQVLGDVLNTGEVQYDQSGPLSDLASRLYSVGGAVLITDNWEHTERLDFDLFEYTLDAVRSMIPGFIGGRTANSHYSSSAILLDYGFAINESNSVEVSLIGSLFTYFALPSVLLGGIFLALVHRLLGRMISSDAAPTAFQLALVAGVASSNAWAYNLDLIGNVRGIVWEIFYVSAAMGGLKIARAFLGAAMQNRSVRPVSTDANLVS